MAIQIQAAIIASSAALAGALIGLVSGWRIERSRQTLDEQNRQREALLRAWDAAVAWYTALRAMLRDPSSERYARESATQEDYLKAVVRIRKKATRDIAEDFQRTAQAMAEHQTYSDELLAARDRLQGAIETELQH